MDKITLESFIAICEAQSFSQAADKLHVTQPAISKRLANLEEQLATQLIDRIGKSVTPTHSGEVLFRHAKKLLVAMDECKTAINNLEDQVSGTLNLGISHHIGLHRLPITLECFAKTYPQVRLNLQFVESPEAFEKVQHGELELAMATLPNQANKDITQHIETTTIWQDPLCFVVSCDHKLATLNDQRTLTTEDFNAYTALLPKANNATRSIIEESLSNKKLDHVIEANSLESIRMMTGIGLGFSALPRTMITKDLRGLSLDIKNPLRELGILQHKSRTISNAARAFLLILKNCNP